MKLHDMRREYLQGGLRRDQLKQEPVEQFELWLQQALDAKLPEPTAMVLATVNEKCQPTQRIVLLKQFDQQGFVFFTNTSSDKANDIKINDQVSLHFPWYPLERQVKVNGVATPLARGVVEEYFASRPQDSQLGAWASTQSQVIPSRDYLFEKYEDYKEKYSDQTIPLPEFWGGYCVTPSEIEFWQGGQYRLHDRFRYRLMDDGQWHVDRLAP